MKCFSRIQKPGGGSEVIILILFTAFTENYPSEVTNLFAASTMCIVRIDR